MPKFLRGFFLAGSKLLAAAPSLDSGWGLLVSLAVSSSRIQNMLPFNSAVPGRLAAEITVISDREAEMDGS